MREIGGRIQMGAQDFKKAQLEFYEAFVNYQSSGNAKAKTCLKMVLVNWLINVFTAKDTKAQDLVNPMESQEAKV